MVFPQLYSRRLVATGDASDQPYKQEYDYYVNNVHTPIGLALSLLGLVANSICVAVFTRPTMQTCFNTLLLSLVVVDLVGLLMFCIDLIGSHRYHSKLCRTYGDVFYYITISFISIFLTGMLNSWLTLSIAVTRYLVITRVYLTMKHVKIILLCSVIVSLIHFIPNLLVLKINKQKNESQTCYIFSQNYDKYISVTTLTLYNVIFFITPVITLMLVSILLIRVIFKARRNFSAVRRTHGGTNHTNTWSNATRTNLVLLGVTVMSFLSKIPYVILAATHGRVVDSKSNYLLKIVFVISWRFTAINCGINLLFFLISKDFRNTLINLIPSKNKTDATEHVDARLTTRHEKSAVNSVIQSLHDDQSSASILSVETSVSKTMVRPDNNSSEHPRQYCGIFDRDLGRIGSDPDSTDQNPHTSHQYPDGNYQNADMVSFEKNDTVRPVSGRKKSKFNSTVNAIRAKSRFQTRRSKRVNPPGSESASRVEVSR